MAQSARVAPGTTVPSSPAKGACEVVVFTQDPNSSLGALPLERLDLLLQVWGDRTEELGELTDIEYVMPFENRGVEVGVTLHHPHGQIYAFPFVPPVAERELQQQELHYQRHQKALLEQLIEGELLDTRRVVYGGDFALGFVPAFARYSYELWVAPKRAAPFLTSLRDDERWDLAKALKTVLLKLDGLWGRPFPYVMALHQAPTDGQPHPEWHLHFELYPALRMPPVEIPRGQRAGRGGVHRRHPARREGRGAAKDRGEA